MTVPFWRDGSWDRTKLGGEVLPGMTASFDVDVARDVKKVKAKKEDGPSLSDDGYTGAGVKIVQEVYTEEQLLLLSVRAAALMPKTPGGPSTPQDVVHPLAAFFGVNALLVQSMSAGKPTKGGRFALNINALEWFPEGSQKATQQNPNSIANGGNGVPGGDGGPIDAGDVPDPDPANLPGGIP